MKLKALAFSLALYFAGVAVSSAQSAQMGTWKLNEAKSSIPAGSIKNTTVVYEAAGDNIKVTTDGFGTDGAPMHTDWTGKFDGKDYPLTGDRNSASRAYTEVDDHTLNFTNKKAGKTPATARIVVATDGKSRILTTHSINPAGKEISGTAVYDKQ